MKVFAKHLEMTTNSEDNESAMIIVFHPRAVKEIFLDGTASFDYELHVSVDGRELRNLDPNVYYNGYEMTFYWNDNGKSERYIIAEVKTNSGDFQRIG